MCADQDRSEFQGTCRNTLSLGVGHWLVTQLAWWSRSYELQACTYIYHSSIVACGLRFNQIVHQFQLVYGLVIGRRLDSPVQEKIISIQTHAAVGQCICEAISVNYEL